MQASLGGLFVELAANMTRFEESMKRAESLTQQTARSIDASASLARHALEALGVGLSVKAFVDFSAKTLETADQLGKMSQKLGTTVEELSKYRYALELSDVPVDALGKGAKALSKFMTEASDGTGRSAAILNKLGVDIKGGVLPALDKIAGTFERLPDGTTKATLATTLFSKAGMDMIPFLNQGSDGIRAMKEEAERLGLVLSGDAAKSAEKFNDSMKTLKFQVEQLNMSFLERMLPGLNRITSAMSLAIKEGGILEGILVGIGGAMMELINPNFNAEPIERYKNIIHDLQNEVDGLKGMEDSLAPGEKARLERAKQELQAAKELLAVEMKKLEVKNKPDKPKPKPSKGLEGELAGLLANGKTGTSDLTKELDRLLNKINEVDGVSRDFAKDMGTLTVAFAMGKLNADDYADAVGKLVKGQKFAKDATQDFLEAQQREQEMAEEELNTFSDWLNAQGQRAQQIERSIEDERLEADAIGKTAVEHKIMLLQLERERALKENPAIQDYINTLYDQKEATARLTDQRNKDLENLTNFWNKAADLADGFFDTLASGGSVFDYLRNQVKALLLEMVKTFARKWILNLGAQSSGASSIAGNTANSFLGNAVSAGGQSLFGSVISGAGTGLGGAFGTGVLTGAGDFVGTGLAGMAGNVALAAGATDAFAATVAAAVPVIGWVVAIGAVLYSLFGNKGGAPKTGGSFMGTFMNGAFTGSSPVPGSDNGRFFTPSEGDVQLQTTVTQLGSSFDALLTQLGAANAHGQISFGLGYDNDPGGDAGARVSSMVRDAMGKVIYSVLDRSVDPDAIGQELGVEVQRMMVAALQNTDLGDSHLNDIADSMTDIAGATSEQLQALIEKLVEMHAVLQGLDQLGQGRFALNLSVEDLQAFQQQGESLGQAFQRIAGNWGQLVESFSSDATKVQQAQLAIAGFGADLHTMGMELPTTREGWLDMMRGLDMSTEAGRELFSRMMALAPAFDAVSDEAERLHQQLMSDTQSFDQFMDQLHPGRAAEQAQRDMTAALTQFMTATGLAGLTPEAALAMIEDMTDQQFQSYDETTRALILTILGLDTSLQQNTSALSTANSINPAYTQQITSGDVVGAFESKVGGLISGQPDFTHQLEARMPLMFNEIQRLTARNDTLKGIYGGSVDRIPEFQANSAAIEKLTADLDKLQGDYADLTVLTGQYGQSIAEQIVQLDDWYDEQKTMLGDNQAALLMLEKLYGDKRKAIIEGGSKDAVDATVEAWARAKDQLSKFLDGLLLDEHLSPYSLGQRTEFADNQFESLLAKAQGGDVDAAGQLAGAAQQYLELARQMFASGADYNLIYERVFNAVAGVAGTTNLNDRVELHLPKDKLASQTDIDELRTAVLELTTVVAGGLAVTDSATVQALRDLNDTIRRSKTGSLA